MPPPEFRTAGVFWRPILRLFRTPALTMPWRRVYWHIDGLDPDLIEDIIAHESVHLDQIDRDGPVTWTVTYLWHLATIGYWDMPYEVEARKAHE